MKAKGGQGMLIRDALIYGEDFRPQRGDLAVREGKIAAIGEHLDPGAWGEVLDARGARLAPGLIDIHVHGGLGYGVEDATAASLDAISRLLASKGVTSFCPTTSSAAPEALEAAFRAVGQHMGRERGAYIHGVHMEGPFIATAQCGAQDPRHVRWPSAEELRRLRRHAPIAILGMSPELPGALALARELASRSRVAFAHSEATYEEARAGIEAGFSHAQRLFCDMPALHHRMPGLAGAVLDAPGVTAELVCDGAHLHPAAARLAFRLLGRAAPWPSATPQSPRACPRGPTASAARNISARTAPYIPAGSARWRAAMPRSTTAFATCSPGGLPRIWLCGRSPSTQPAW